MFLFTKRGIADGVKAIWGKFNLRSESHFQVLELTTIMFTGNVDICLKVHHHSSWQSGQAGG